MRNKKLIPYKTIVYEVCINKNLQLLTSLVILPIFVFIWSAYIIILITSALTPIRLINWCRRKTLIIDYLPANVLFSKILTFKKNIKALLKQLFNARLFFQKEFWNEIVFIIYRGTFRVVFLKNYKFTEVLITLIYHNWNIKLAVYHLFLIVLE